MSSKKIDKVIQVESIADLNSFNLKNYINFVRRSGGEMFQYYSLLDSYSEYLGYGSGNNSGSNSGYRETEVSFSREIYKKRVLSSVVLPLYMEDFSANGFSFNGSLTETGAERNYFQVRLVPSWYDRHLNNFSLEGGELRNVYKRANQNPEGTLNTGMICIGGEFRLPLLRYRHETPDSVLTGSIILSGGELRKILIKAKTPIDSVDSKDINFLGLFTSTNRKNDIIEVGFDSISSPENSLKTDSNVLDDFSTVEDSTEFVGEPTLDSKSIRILNKKGGIIVQIPSDSVEISPISDWTLGINGMPRELSPGSSLISIPGFISITLDEADPTKLHIKITPTLDIRTESSIVGLNKWVNVSVESVGGIIHVYVDGLLVGKATEPLPLTTKIFPKGTSIYVGNDSSKTNGFIGNVDNLIIIKGLAQNASKGPTPSLLKREIIGSELSLSPIGDVGDKVVGVNWEYGSKPGYNPITKGIVFEASQYLVSKNTADVSMYNFNNYKIEMVFFANTLPSLNYPLRTLIHKTGTSGDGDSSHLSGYHLSLASVDDSVKALFRVGNVSLYSSRSIQIKTPYKIEVFKYNKYLMMFINDVFENLVSFNNQLAEDPLSDLLIGRFKTQPSYDFQGEIYSWIFTNYYTDKSSDPEKNNLLKRYLPENTSDTSVLNFERSLYDEGDPRRVWLFGDNLVADEQYLDKQNTKFGDVSLSLNPTTKFISLRKEPVFDLKNEEFTLESWVYLKEDNTFSTIISNGVSQTSSNKAMYRALNIDSLGRVVFEGSTIGTGLPTSVILRSSSRILLNTWSHVALVRSKTAISLYINGVRVGQTVAPSLFVDLSVENTLLGTGKWNSEVGSQLTGNLDSFRLTKSKALYEGESFPLPTKPFGNIDTGRVLDLTFDKKSNPAPLKEILLNFDKVPEPEAIKAGIINSESLTQKELLLVDYMVLDFESNYSIKGRFPGTVTVTGGSLNNISSDNSRFGTKSFKGAYNCGLIIKNEIFNFGLEDFTIDFWNFRPSIVGSDYEVFYSSGLTNVSWFGVKPSTREMISRIKTSEQPELSLIWSDDDTKRSLNKWNHIAVTRNKGVFRLFLNGTLMDEKNLPNELFNLNAGVGFCLGNTYGVPSEYFRGYLDSFRVIKGYAAFTENFNSENLKNPSEVGVYSNNPQFSSEIGSVVKDTQEKLFGSSSIKFKGASGLIGGSGTLNLFAAPINSDTDFTLEFDIRFEENYDSKIQTIIASSNQNSKFFSVFKYGNNTDIDADLKNKLGLTLDKNYVHNLILSDTRLENSRWYNVTITRYKGILKLFLDGILSTKVFDDKLIIDFSNTNILVGSSQEPLTAMKGNIESLRLTPGISLYKNSFQTPNKYFDEESSEFYNLNYSNYKIKDLASGVLLDPLQVADSSIVSEEGSEFLRTKLSSTTSYKGAFIYRTNPVLELGLDDFTIEYKFRVFIDKSFNAFQRNTSSPTVFSQVTDTYSRPTLKNAVTFETNNSSVSLKTPQNSYQVGTWNVVTITRTSGKFNLYLNGTIRDSQTVQQSISLGNGYDLFIAGGSLATEMDIDYFYINKGLAKPPEEVLEYPTVKRVGFKERLEILSSSAENFIPDSCYFENNSLDQLEFVEVTDVKKIFNLAANFKGQSYLKMDNFPAISRAFVLDFWFHPDKRVDVAKEVTLLKIGQSDLDTDKGLTVKILPDNYLYVNIKSENQATAFVLSDLQVLQEEWNSCRLIFKDGLLDVYLNGNMVGYYQNRNPTFFEGSLGKLYLGYDPTVLYSLPFKGYLDHLSFYKYTLKVPSGYRYYNSLQSLFKDSNKELFPLRLENGEIPNNLVGWKTSAGDVGVKAINAVSGSKFFVSTDLVTPSRITQEIDLSAYLNDKDLNIYVSWTQLKELVYNTESSGRVYIEFLDKFKNRLTLLQSKNKPVASSEDYTETERFLFGVIPSHCKYLKVHVELLGDSGIRNIQIFTENLGLKYYDRTRDIIEVFEPLEELPRTVASRYYSYDPNFENYNKEDLVTSVGFKDINYKNPNNTIYNDISADGLVAEYSGRANMVLRDVEEIK